MTLTYRTRAEPPKIGEWIRSTRRPRCAYFVVGIERKGPFRIGGTVGFDPPIVYRIEVERRPAQAPLEGDVVHPIFWDARGRR